MDRIPFHTPTIEAPDIAAAVEVLESGWITTGPQCRLFETEFSAYLSEGADDLHAVAVTSATAAMHLACEAIGLASGDQVLTTPFTFTASSEVLRYLGADPLFVDVDPETFNLDPSTVRSVFEQLPTNVRQRVRAILPVHYGGLPCDMKGFEAFADQHDLRVVDDAAHALPTRHDGRMIGTYGHATAFSFYATKTLCTGEGGMIVTRNEELAERMRVMRLHGISRDVFDRYVDPKPAWHYEVIAPGFKYNMPDILAALGRTQLRRVEDFQQDRERVANAYDAAFGGQEGLRTPQRASDGDTHSWHLYPLRIDDGLAVRNAFIDAMAERGIGTSVHFIPLHLHPYWRDRYDLKPSDFPNATRLYEQEVSLPIYPALTPAQIDRVVNTVPEALAAARDAVSSSSN